MAGWYHGVTRTLASLRRDRCVVAQIHTCKIAFSTSESTRDIHGAFVFETVWKLGHAFAARSFGFPTQLRYISHWSCLTRTSDQRRFVVSIVWASQHSVYPDMRFALLLRGFGRTHDNLQVQFHFIAYWQGRQPSLYQYVASVLRIWRRFHLIVLLASS